MSAGWGVALSMIGSVVQGVGTYAASKKSAKSIIEQGELALWESGRESLIIREESVAFSQNQKLQYLSAGVGYSGSAVVTIKHSQWLGEQEAAATEKRGSAQFELARQNASATRKAGIMALWGGILQAGSTAANASK